ncbi:MAG: GNAT family N-acetyltransferase [Candidatus Kariarchaeaceae archaeon]|jgi:RimJ/RimL family protein N-acetyltransferase
MFPSKNNNSSFFDTKKGLNIEIKKINTEDLSEVLLDGYFNIYNHIFYETYPKEDPLPNKDAIQHQLLNPHPHYTIHRWFVFYEQKVIGLCRLHYTNENSPSFDGTSHIAHGKISIHHEFRRQGIATELLKIIVSNAMKANKTILQTDVYLDIAVNFCKEVLKANPAKTGNENRLYFDQVNWDLMRKWVDEGKERTKNVSLHIYQEIPDDILDDFCEIYNETSSQEPSDELEEHYIETSESRRIQEKQFRERNQTLITILTKEVDNKISSLTEIFYDPKDNFQGSQWLTGVKMEYRGRGLGKWIKAAMLLYLKENYPSIKFVRAGNADLNAPMRSINERMGFKTIFKRYDYNLRLEEISRILDLK